MIAFKRGLVEHKLDVKSTDFFKFYNSLYKGTKHQILDSQFRKIIKLFNEALMEEIIFKAYDFNVPYGLGKLCIRKTKSKNKIKDGKIIITLPIDWKATKQLWEEDEEAKAAKKLVRVNNSHSDNYICGFKYKNFLAKSVNTRAYGFKVSRPNKITLSKVLKDSNLKIDYFEN